MKNNKTYFLIEKHFLSRKRKITQDSCHSYNDECRRKYTSSTRQYGLFSTQTQSNPWGPLANFTQIFHPFTQSRLHHHSHLSILLNNRLAFFFLFFFSVILAAVLFQSMRCDFMIKCPNLCLVGWYSFKARCAWSIYGPNHSDNGPLILTKVYLFNKDLFMKSSKII